MTPRAAAGRLRCAAMVAGACCCVCSAAGAQSGVRVAPAGVRRAPAIAGPVWLSQAAPAPDAKGRPSLDAARVAGEVLAGAYAGVAGYFLGSWIGNAAGDMISGASDDAKEHITFVTGIVGAGAATAASVAAVGNIGDQTGSYSAALAGTAAGVGVGLLLNQVLYGHARLPREEGSSRMRWIEASLEAMLPSIGATIAFNSTRKFK